MDYTHYTIRKVMEDGVTLVIPLDGEEAVVTTCPECGSRHEMDLMTFADVLRDGDIYSTRYAVGSAVWAGLGEGMLWEMIGPLWRRNRC